MTANDILKRAQGIWGDALATQIAALTSVSTLEWLSDGIVALFSAKPFAKMSPTTLEYLTPDDLSTLTTLASTSTTIDIERKWLVPLSHYVAAMGFYSDAENQGHRERAQEHMALFTKFLSL